MQGFSDPQRELLDADSVTGHLLPTGSVGAVEEVDRRMTGEEQGGRGWVAHAWLLL